MLRAIDFTGELLGNIDFIEASWNRRWSEPGEFMVYMALDEYNRLNALGMKYVENVGRPETGIIQKTEYSRQTDGAFVTVSGYFTDKLLDFGAYRKTQVVSEQTADAVESAISSYIQNAISEVTIDGVTYTINLQGFLYGGVGFSGNSVKWKDTKNKIHSGYVYWASSPSEAMAAISEYCVAVSKINTKAWKEAASYFLTGTPNSKIVDFGSKIVEALCDTNAGKALAETIGTEFKKEYKSGFFGLGNTFKEFVKQLPGGEKIIKVAETISKTKDACANLVDNINNFKNNFDKLGDGTNDIVDMVDLLNNNYNFSTMEINNLSRKMQELDNAISQAKTEKLNDLPEYKRQTVDEIYAEHNQRQ